MLNDSRRRGNLLVDMGLHKKLDVLMEGVWLLIIFLLPVYFNPWCHDSYYFVKVLALVFLVSLLLGLALAQWFLAPLPVRMRDLPAKIKESPLQSAAVALGLMWVVSTVCSVMPAKSLWGNLSESAGFMPNLAWIIFFLVIAQKVRRRAQIYRALYTLLVSSGIVALVGILQFVRPDIMLQGDQFSGRVFSTDGNPLSLSGFLAMAMPITLALAIVNWYGWGSSHSKLRFAALLALFGLQLCCLVLAQYSLTLLLFIIGVFVFFGLLGIFLQRRAILAMSILSMLLVAVIAIVLLGQVMLTVKTGLPDESPGANAPAAGQVALPSLGIRMLGWKCAVDVLIDSPEIPFSQDNVHYLRRFIGYGPETFVATSQLRFPDALKGFYTFRSVGIAQPENHYLYLAVTMGLLGLLAFLGLLAVFFTLGFRLLARSKNKEAIVLTAAFVASIAQYCAHICFNSSVVAPELVFWLVLGLTVALVKVESTDIPGNGSGTPVIDSTAGAIPMPGKLRKLTSVLIIIIFVAIGSGLTLPMMIASMKVQSGFALWNKDQDLALASFREATLIGPDQANYHDILGNAAYSLAMHDRTAPEVKSSLMDLSESANNAAIRLEPQMAVWRYRLADRQMYRIIDGSAEKKANILQLYREADQLFPGNAVILNKWALALILTDDYPQAEQKLLESGKNDAAWVQTSYFKGLLKMHQGDIDGAGGLFVSAVNNKLDEAGGLFVSPITSNLKNIGYFISFCAQAAAYGEIGTVRDALGVYVKNKSDDWTGFALLGIADVYSDNPADALADFKRSSLIVTDEEAAALAAIVEGSLSRHQDLRNESEEIIRGLMERASRVQ
jgi:tetratricopeptide (TPR) repeat protein